MPTPRIHGLTVLSAGVRIGDVEIVERQLAAFGDSSWNAIPPK